MVGWWQSNSAVLMLSESAVVPLDERLTTKQTFFPIKDTSWASHALLLTFPATSSVPENPPDASEAS